MTRIYHIPLEAAEGGAETEYPAYRDKIKAEFTMPPACKQNCGNNER